MSYLVVFVVDDPDQCNDVLHAWDDAGAKGITILESTGMGRVRREGIRDDIPLMPSLSDILRSSETHHRTLFSVVENETIADKLLQAAESVVGSLENPNTGLLFIVPIYKVYGMRKPD